MTGKTIRIGGACGYWGESAIATPQLLRAGDLDYLVYDYLAEITMSIMARARARNPEAGFATDFVTAVLDPCLAEIARQRIKLIANAGGVNPRSCGAAVRRLVAARGLALKVAVVTGDDLLDQYDRLAARGVTEMSSGGALPDRAAVASINAYLGAFPIAKALDGGADIVITGRCVDSALTLGACIHEFGWEASDWDRLASGSLAGHVLECGPQATGGNFTDWELAAPKLADIGYPIAEIGADGSFIVTKPEGTGGLVSAGTVAEQMVYEIGDPQAYVLPDVTCDFSAVTLTPVGQNRIRVSPARGRPAPDRYKVCLTYAEGFRGGAYLTYYGFEADRKAAACARAVFERARAVLHEAGRVDFPETSVELIGADSQFGAAARAGDWREVVVKIAAKHPEANGIGALLKEIAGIGLATPPGLSAFTAVRSKPTPVVRLFSFLTPKQDLRIRIESDGESRDFKDAAVARPDRSAIVRPEAPAVPKLDESMAEVPLIKLAWGRSGDKGDSANVGIVARDPDYLPYIWSALSETAVAACFAHFMERPDAPGQVERFLMPGIYAVNFLVHSVLGGGGVASIRNDAQGKGYAQLLLFQPITVPARIAERVGAN